MAARRGHRRHRPGCRRRLPGEGAFAASGTNVAVHGANDAWFATGAASKARVLHTRDRGRSWTIADTPLIAGPSSGAFSVAFRDASHGVVVGGDYQKEGEALNNLAVTSDGGRTWTLVKERGLSGFRSVVTYVPGTKMSVIAVGPQGADWSEDDGRTLDADRGRGLPHVQSLDVRASGLRCRRQREYRKARDWPSALEPLSR